MKLLFPVATQAPKSSEAALRPKRGVPLRVGLLHNCKPNGEMVLRTVYDALEQDGIAHEGVYRTKHTAGEGASLEIFDDLRQCDLVLTALAC